MKRRKRSRRHSRSRARRSGPPVWIVGLILLALAIQLFIGAAFLILTFQKEPEETAVLASAARDMTADTATNLPAQEEDPEIPTLPSGNENPEPLELDFEEDGRARELLNSMSLEEKVGQMLIACCPMENATQTIADYHLGGCILFAQDFEGKTPEQVAANIQSYQDAADIPLLICVDEEGGTVVRISRFSAFRETRFSSSQEVYAAGGFDAIREDTIEKCQLLKSLGVNVNFAPVCDISEDPNDFIYDRSFGKDAEQTSEFVNTVISTMKTQGVASVLKHFPGYGNNIDTHTGIAYDNRPYETFEVSDFLPFQAGINCGADMVLVSHNIVSCMDGMNPASLSPGIHQILRQDLNFSGVIITDDLGMKGVLQFAGSTQAAVLAVQAGNDLLCCTDFEAPYTAILQAVEDGDISEWQIDESVLRILNLKLNLELLE